MAGAEIYARNLSVEFARQGAHVEVFCPGEDRSRSEYELWTEEQDGLRVHRMNRAFSDVHSLDDTWNSLGAEESFREVLSRFQPEIVHVHHVIGLSSSENLPFISLCLSSSLERTAIRSGWYLSITRRTKRWPNEPVPPVTRILEFDQSTGDGFSGVLFKSVILQSDEGWLSFQQNSAGFEFGL